LLLDISFPLPPDPSNPLHIVPTPVYYQYILEIPPALFLSGLFRSSNQVRWPQLDANIARAVRNAWPLAPLLLEPSRSTSDLTYS
jgi:hypothetical protein